MAEGGGEGHSVIDLGSDEYTVGRPHPMIDPMKRNELLARSLSDPGVAAVLVDVVIGHGAHADPGGELAEAIMSADESKAVVIASVCGTEEDPQVHSEQVKKLESAGVLVFSSNALAAEMALRISRRDI